MTNTENLLSQLKIFQERGELQGIYKNLPSEVYHLPECPGYSSTFLKKIRSNSMNHAVAESKSTKQKRFGSAFHAYILEPDVFQMLYSVVEPQLDKETLTQKEFDGIRRLADSYFAHPDVKHLLSLGQATTELSYFAKDEETDLWMKCRFDLKIPGIAVDLKTTRDASPQSFAQDSKKYGYRLSAAYYLDICSKIEGVPHDSFYLIACENEAPYQVKVYRVHPDSIEMGRQEYKEALNKIKLYRDAGPGAWGGYDLGIVDLFI